MTRAKPPLSLTREAILGNSLRALVQAADPEAHCMTPEEHRASIKAALDQRTEHGDVWLFGYGSLIWNPLIHYVEKQVGTVHGYHRCFCLWSHTGRGTKANPGLMLGLERGGACRGIAFRIAEALAADELEVVWRREMLTGAYAPRWVTVVTKGARSRPSPSSSTASMPAMPGSCPRAASSTRSPQRMDRSALVRHICSIPLPISRSWASMTAASSGCATGWRRNWPKAAERRNSPSPFMLA